MWCTTTSRWIALGAVFWGMLLGAASPVRAGFPVTGVPVSELSAFDDAMQEFMAAHGHRAAVLAVMKDGCVVYQRGFGYAFNQLEPLSENTPMRLASISKPIVKVAIEKLHEDRLLDVDDFVFDLGQEAGGLLDLPPWPGPGPDHESMKEITVDHLLEHVSGIPQWMEFGIEIGIAMGVSCPSGIENMIRYALGKPLACIPPGSSDCEEYNNFNYAILGHVIADVSGLPADVYIQRNILTPEIWVPATDVYQAMPFRSLQSPREPLYNNSVPRLNFFEPVCGTGPRVPWPYGGIELIAGVGGGGIVSSAAPLLIFMNEYSTYRTAGGGMPGTSTYIAQRKSEGISLAVLLSKDGPDPGNAWNAAATIFDIIDNNSLNWPTTCVDGFWVDFNASVSGFGGFDDPFHTIGSMLSSTTDGTRLNIKPGSSSWTGRISQRLRIDASFGAARIGE